MREDIESTKLLIPLWRNTFKIWFWAMGKLLQFDYPKSANINNILPNHPIVQGMKANFRFVAISKMTFSSLDVCTHERTAAAVEALHSLSQLIDYVGSWY